MSIKHDQWIRKVGLVVFTGDKGLDLSEFHIQFSVAAADVQTPNNVSIRIYNLSDQTVSKIKGEFSQVVLNAGYVDGNYGLIFKGSIKQFRIGRVDNVTTYLDILAADGDLAYNGAVVNTSLVKGSTQNDAINVITTEMQGDKTPADITKLTVTKANVPSIRGTVLFGMARERLKNTASQLDASWSIQNGVVTIIDKSGYSPNDVLELNAGTGLIGVPEQTDGGIRIRCLLNSRLRIGGSVKINNAALNQLIQQNPDNGPIPFDQRAGFQYNAPISNDGIYRIFVVEHDGDTRGTAWYTNLICLAVDASSPTNQAVADQ